MTEYGSGEWEARSEVRKQVRDVDRKAFWERAGVKVANSINEVSYAPKNQRVNIVRLLQVTRDGKIDNQLNEFLPNIAQSMRSISLGLGEMGTVSENITDLSKNHTRILEHFFIHEYKLEGPREKP